MFGRYRRPLKSHFAFASRNAAGRGPGAHAAFFNRRNEIGEFPHELGEMHALRSLRAHSNNLETLPAAVGGLVSLELCDLGSNR